jgi:sRNA-binding carbon storage regulator CsrA
MIGKDVRLTFLESNDRSLKIMIDAPKEINIARGKAIEKRAMEQETAADRDWFD